MKRILAGLLLVACSIAAFASLLGDSLTFDETTHLTSGLSYLETGDFRLAPDHPPLAKMWAALPLLVVPNRWPPPETPGWHEGNVFRFGRTWLFDLNDGERLLLGPRLMMVVLLLILCCWIWRTADRMWGPAGGLVALACAAFSPTLLAHGHLVTTDLPAALCMMLVLQAAAELMVSITWRRLAWACLVSTALVLAKFSWPLVGAGVLTMTVITLLRSSPIESPWGSIRGPARKLASLAACGVVVGLAVWAGVWTCFGWRYSPFRGDDAASATLISFADPGEELPGDMAGAWETILHDHEGRPLTGSRAAAIRWAARHRLLPEAYLYGLAYTLRTSLVRSAYLMGEFSDTGFRSYFPVAFAIKTPLALMLLVLAGLGALALRRIGCREPLLLSGLAGFAVVYAGVAITASLNIGHRHLLPIYPLLFVLAGAAAGWLGAAAGRIAVAASLGWLVAASLWVHPHYLSYFNETIGGPSNGYLYLVDSNLDWGQDLKRLAAWTRRESVERIKLAYFGSGDPTRYGFECEMLPSTVDFGRPARLRPGVYVVSATQLVGAYVPLAREGFWRVARNREVYARLDRLLSRTDILARPDRAGEAARAIPRLHRLRRGRLLNALLHRRPDDRIGYSLFVYRLSDSDLESLLAPD